MKKLKLLIILLIPLLLLTGCDSGKLDKYVKNTSIKDKGLKSYRCKVNITTKDKSINYVVLNKENKDYNIVITSDKGTYSYEINGKDVVRNSLPEGFELHEEYDYKDTDKFLDGLKNINEVKESKEKIDKEEYTKYEFKVSKSVLNKILSSYGIKAKKDGKAYIYVDKDVHIYIINYESGKINLNVSYTRYNDVK